jgi:hypothetical protein
LLTLADVYGDDFFAQIDGVTNALDNVAARQYMEHEGIDFSGGSCDDE